MLGNFVNGLGPASLEEHVHAIRDTKEPASIADLERFLGITGYLRDKIPEYAEVAEPLQRPKTALLQGAPIAGQRRKNLAQRTNRQETRRILRLDGSPHTS